MAIWMLPSDRSWPPEIDLLELLGNDPHRTYRTHHWGSRKRDLHHTTDFVGPDFTQDFHTFSIEWEPGKLRWLIDDVERKVETAHVPSKAMYLILNTSVGVFTHRLNQGAGRRRWVSKSTRPTSP